jgi:hypothetical protein
MEMTCAVRNDENSKLFKQNNMKTKMSKQILLLAALGCMAAPVAAQTVDVTLQCGQSYTINSTVDASAGTATITYQWLENGSTITGASAASYIVPATKSVGLYTYIRQAKTDDCPDWQSSNAFTVEVKNKNDLGVCLGGVMWAKYNVDEPGSFTNSQTARGKFYRFNSNVPFPSSGVCTWPEYVDDGSATWKPENEVCPPDWRLPTIPETISLNLATVCQMHISYQSAGDLTLHCSKCPCSLADTLLNTTMVLTGYSTRFNTNDIRLMRRSALLESGRALYFGDQQWGSGNWPNERANIVRCVLR